MPPLWEAVVLLSQRRVLFPPTVPLRLLRRMASLGFASESGHLFHVQPQADRMAAHLRSPQGDFFQ